MYIVFYSTNDVFRAEELLNSAGQTCKISPTPVSDKAYCGVCIETDNICVNSIITDMEYEIIE